MNNCALLLLLFCQTVPPAPGHGVRREYVAAPVKPRVRLAVFGVCWRESCPALKRNLLVLREAGWETYHNDVDKTRDSRWTRYHLKLTSLVPHLLILIDGKPWQHKTGASSIDFLADWLRAADEEWYERHGVPLDKRVRRTIPPPTTYLFESPVYYEPYPCCIPFSIPYRGGSCSGCW